MSSTRTGFAIGCVDNVTRCCVVRANTSLAATPQDGAYNSSKPRNILVTISTAGRL